MRGIQMRVTEGIGRQIISGEYAPGVFLPKEAELTEQFGVSRTSVREGMRVLAAKGLVDIRQKIGTRVRQPEQWNVFDNDILRWHSEVGRGNEIMRDLLEVREVLEPAAARLAAGRASSDDQGRINNALSAMVSAATDRETFAPALVEFHLSVYAATHNALLRQFGSVVAEILRASFREQQLVASDHETFSGNTAPHGVVRDAIACGNGAAAAEAMLHVVLKSKKALISSRLDQNDGATTS